MKNGLNSGGTDPNRDDVTDWIIYKVLPVHLAGEEGYALEKEFGAGTAGTLIYVVSRPDKPIPDFYYADNEEALADLRMCAEEESS